MAGCAVTRVKTVGNSVEGNLGEITGYVFEAVLDGPWVNISVFVSLIRIVMVV